MARLRTGRPDGMHVIKRDFVALGIATAAIIMFVGTGGSVIPQIVRSLSGNGIGPERVLVTALLLNVALVVFGWRRYRQLAEEVQERRRAEEQARLLAETDPLTGCLNRRSLADAANALIAASQDRGEAVALMMIDLDNFKHINDFNGHSAGDHLLKICAERIAAQLPDRSLLARMGGDEFAAVVPYTSGRHEVIDEVAAAIVEKMARPVTESGNALRVSGSIGIARSDARAPSDVGPNDAKTLLHMADIAMYHAKSQGRNRYFWFEEQMAAELRFRKEIELGIRQGIQRGEFVPYYEQQIDLESGRLTGFEMLARWNSPKLGLVSPEVFIPIAEDIGAIADLSESVIAQALDDAKSWDADITLSVNISPVQLRDPWFAQRLLKLLVTANFPPHRLEIEVTESCLHENVGMVRTLISSLKNQGIRVSLDDFGTGYSSLAQLCNLPFDRIKIDRSFVIDLAENKDSAAIVDAITRLGAGLGLPITAEGIQSGEVLDRLRQYGSLKGQGYHFGKPLSSSATRDWLASQNRLGGSAGGVNRPQTDEPRADPPAPPLAGNG